MTLLQIDWVVFIEKLILIIAVVSGSLVIANVFNLHGT
jgi:hypothetical protein